MLCSHYEKKILGYLFAKKHAKTIALVIVAICVVRMIWFFFLDQSTAIVGNNPNDDEVNGE